MFLFLLLHTTLSCPQDSEESILAALSNNLIPTNDCIKQALDKGWYEAAIGLVSYTAENNVELDPSLKANAQALRKKLEKFINIIEKPSEFQIISPAFQWAQSPTHVFLDIKFSHKLDSPGCLQVANPEVSLTDSRLFFTGTCARSTQKIKLVLDLEYFTNINAAESSYSFTSVGRLSVNLRKRMDLAWPKLVREKKPSNGHIWWEMKEKYQEEMNKLTGEEYDEDEKGQIKAKPIELNFG